MLRLVDRLKKQLDQATSLDQAMASLTDAGRRIGFSMSAYYYAPHPRNRDGVLQIPTVHRTNPVLDEFDRIYARRSYFRYDPVYSACLKTTLPVIWSFTDQGHQILGAQSTQNAVHSRLAHDANKAGVRSGLAIPLHLPHGELAVVGFLADVEFDEFIDRAIKGQYVAMVLAHYFHDCVGRVLGTSLGQDLEGVILSPREIECLQWASQGKTNNDIATILGVAEITARVHLKNASRKLGACNRTHAVGKALSAGLIDPVA